MHSGRPRRFQATPPMPRRRSPPALLAAFVRAVNRGVARHRRDRPLLRRGEHRARIEAARQSHADGHVAAHPQPYRILEQLGESRVIVAASLRINDGIMPEAAHRRGSVADPERRDRRRRQGGDVAVIARLASVRLRIDDYVVNGRQIGFAQAGRKRDQRLGLRPEDQSTAIDMPVEGFHPEPVARQRQLGQTRFPDREGPHAVQPGQHVLAPL